MSNMDTMLERYGEDELRKWRSKGGKRKVSKGFGKMTPEERQDLGRKGGRKSRRPKKLL